MADRGMMDEAVEQAYTRVAEQGILNAGEVDLNLAAHAWSVAEYRKMTDEVLEVLYTIRDLLIKNGNGRSTRRERLVQYGTLGSGGAVGGGAVAAIPQLLQVLGLG